MPPRRLRTKGIASRNAGGPSAAGISFCEAIVLPANFSGVALAFHRDEALFRGRAMYRIIAAVVLSCLAACAANRSLGSASFVYEIGYESGCARAYVEAKPSPWP